MLTARTEVTDRMLIFGERHLRLVVAEYARHYNGRRPHRSRELPPPRPDHPVDLFQKRIRRRPVLGALSPEQLAIPLIGRPYALRHAGIAFRGEAEGPGPAVKPGRGFRV